MEYPRWRHHAKHGGKLVNSEEESKALGEGWGDDSSVWRGHLLRKEEAVEVRLPSGLDPVIEKPIEPPPASQKGKPGRKPKEMSQ
jgi:hypothetical protein